MKTSYNLLKSVNSDGVNSVDLLLIPSPDKFTFAINLTMCNILNTYLQWPFSKTMRNAVFHSYVSPSPCPGSYTVIS